MAVVRVKTDSGRVPRKFTLHRDVDTSAANTAVTVSTESGSVRKVLFVAATITAAGSSTVTITLNSGAGAGYDSTLGTIDLTAAVTGQWIPSSEIWISATDVIDATASAAGASKTAAVSVYTASV